MNRNILILTLFLPLILIFSASCNRIFSESDTSTFQLVSFYDLRDRDSFVQITNTSTSPNRVHVQVFDVGNNCNENNFFDALTGNDTHVYNLRDIQTNDGTPSGIVLPDGAYGIVVITVVDTGNFAEAIRDLIGNFRILDGTGYEYRTNSLGISSNLVQVFPESIPEYYLNFNQQSGVIFSDVVGFTLEDAGLGEFGTNNMISEVLSTDIVDINILIDVDIFDLNENIFSCRNIIFACTDQDNPRLEELLETVGGANVASFEYGINEAIPHSKGGELLCPGNNIGEGFARLRILAEPGGSGFAFGVFLGLNNGNGRGSMDSFWDPNYPLVIADEQGQMDGDDFGDLMNDGTSL